jgi:hypothetical protein
VPTQALGLSANSPVNQTLYSDPVTLTSSTSSSTGTFASSATLPSTLPLGRHTLSLSGTTNTGLPFTLAIGVVVATPAAALGADPVLSTTPRTAAPNDSVVVMARGVQVGCRVTFASGRERQYVTASKSGTTEATVLVGATTRKQWPITATVTGKGCLPVRVSTSIKVTPAEK